MADERHKIGVPTTQVCNPAEMPNCPQCGAELGSDDPAGLCPECLIQGAFESSAGADESRTQTIDTATAAADGDDFGRYQIVRSIGEGGMGTVYLAEQLAVPFTGVWLLRL